MNSCSGELGAAFQEILNLASVPYLKLKLLIP
jgi:hypothetical protein